jgi:hypothetical protein
MPIEYKSQFRTTNLLEIEVAPDRRNMCLGLRFLRLLLFRVTALWAVTPFSSERARPFRGSKKPEEADEKLATCFLWFRNSLTLLP